MFGMMGTFIALGVALSFGVPYVPAGTLAILGESAFGLLIVLLILGELHNPPKPYQDELLTRRDEVWINKCEAVSLLLLIVSVLLFPVMTQFAIPYAVSVGVYGGCVLVLLGSSSFIIGRITLGKHGLRRPSFTGNSAKVVSIFLCVCGSGCISFFLHLLIGA